MQHVESQSSVNIEAARSHSSQFTVHSSHLNLKHAYLTVFNIARFTEHIYQLIYWFPQRLQFSILYIKQELTSDTGFANDHLNND
jgi:hypothetical protein